MKLLHLETLNKVICNNSNTPFDNKYFIVIHWDTECVKYKTNIPQHVVHSYIRVLFHYKTKTKRITTFIKVNLKESDDETNIDKYRIAYKGNYIL